MFYKAVLQLLDNVLERVYQYVILYAYFHKGCHITVCYLKMPEADDCPGRCHNVIYINIEDLTQEVSPLIPIQCTGYSEKFPMMTERAIH